MGYVLEILCCGLLCLFELQAQKFWISSELLNLTHADPLQVLGVTPQTTKYELNEQVGCDSGGVSFAPKTPPAHISSAFA